MTYTRIIADNLDNLIRDIQNAYPSKDKVLIHLLLACLRECLTHIEEYYINANSDMLSKSLFSTVYDFLLRYEAWIETTLFEEYRSKVLHELILRHSKGILKALRIWRIDGLKK